LKAGKFIEGSGMGRQGNWKAEEWEGRGIAGQEKWKAGQLEGKIISMKGFRKARESDAR